MDATKSKFNIHGFRERRRSPAEQSTYELILQFMERDRGQPVLPIEPHCCPKPGCNQGMPCTWNTDMACACRPDCIPPRLRKFFDGACSHDERTAFFRRLRGQRLVAFNLHMAGWRHERLVPSGANLMRNEVGVGPDRPLTVDKKVQTAPEDSAVLARIASTASAQLVEMRRIVTEVIQAHAAPSAVRPAIGPALAPMQAPDENNVRCKKRQRRSLQRAIEGRMKRAKQVWT